MATPTVDLSRMSTLAEIILRSGNVAHPNARQVLQVAYVQPDPAYPDAIGISTLFREGATLDELAREGAFPHSNISYSVIGRITAELATVGYGLVLFATPTALLPDHHSLAITHNGAVQIALPDDGALALIRAFSVVSNPYRRP